MKKSELKQMIRGIIEEIYTPSEVELLIKQKGYVKNFKSEYFEIINVYPKQRRGVIVIDYGGRLFDLDFSEVSTTTETRHGRPVWRWTT